MQNCLDIQSRVKLASHTITRLVSNYWKAVRLEMRALPRDRCKRTVLTRVAGVLYARVRYSLGPVYYSLYRLSDVPKAEWSDYLTDAQFKRKLRAVSPSDVLRIAHDKLLMYEHCLTHGLTAVPVLCVVGKPTDSLCTQVPVVGSLEIWRSLIQGVRGALFVKPAAGFHGEGAFTVCPKADRFEFDGQLGSLDELYYHIEQKCKTGDRWIVQPRVETHAGLVDYVSQNALPTIRAVTTMAGDKPELLFAAVKITVGSNTVDNFHQGKDGNLIAAVDTVTGRLACPWGSRSRDWPSMAPVSAHPDSQMPIEGKVLPCWDGVVTLATKAQASLPALKSIGWDIAISEDGPLLVEANSPYDVSILQVAYQRGLRHEFNQICNGSL